MPIHDWKSVRSGLYHPFHNAWLVHLMDHLNGGVMPRGFYALTDTRVDIFAPDLVAVRRGRAGASGGLATLPTADRRTVVTVSRLPRQRHLKVYDQNDKVVAVVEIVSPANKDRRASVADFANKTAAFLTSGVNVVVADILPPTKAAPNGMHPPLMTALAVRMKVDRPPADRPLTVAAYQAGRTVQAHLYYTAVGRPIPTAPLFLDAERFVLLPLEETYQTTVDRLTPELRATLGG
jgi:hypothetical protein